MEKEPSKRLRDAPEARPGARARVLTTHDTLRLTSPSHPSLRSPRLLSPSEVKENRTSQSQSTRRTRSGSNFTISRGSGSYRRHSMKPDERIQGQGGAAATYVTLTAMPLKQKRKRGRSTSTGKAATMTQARRISTFERFRRGACRRDTCRSTFHKLSTKY